jgi:thiamine pyrophosphate-dependent acetolactate synthase large subunit-like protein
MYCGTPLVAPLPMFPKLVVAIMGDAPLGMTGMDFETAVRQKIPILIIVLNNSVLAGIGKDVDKTEPAMYRLSEDYVKFAEAMGGYGECVEKPDEIIPAIKRAKKALDSDRPALLNVITKEELALSSSIGETFQF